MGLFDRNRGSDEEQQRRAEEPLRPQEMDKAPGDGADAPASGREESASAEERREEAQTEEQQAAGGSTAVKNEPDRKDERQREGDEDGEYQWHTGRQRPHGQEDAVEFVEVHKAFGRNKILRGLNMGIPNNKISMILGP